ncbi:MAG: hypothetical protein H6502_04810 [Candidatus Woesearchaeota archaeon]|nr:MAG: hypothetical protein H6502_04810 [Candidatus Woesearchaeota archaeon]
MEEQLGQEPAPVGTGRTLVNALLPVALGVGAAIGIHELSDFVGMEGARAALDASEAYSGHVGRTILYNMAIIAQLGAEVFGGLSVALVSRAALTRHHTRETAAYMRELEQALRDDGTCTNLDLPGSAGQRIYEMEQDSRAPSPHNYRHRP